MDIWGSLLGCEERGGGCTMAAGEAVETGEEDERGEDEDEEEDVYV